MKSKIKFGKGLIALLLSFIMIFTMGIPAFAMEERFFDEEDPSGDGREIAIVQEINSTDNMIKVIHDQITAWAMADAERHAASLDAAKAAKAAAESWTGMAKSFFGTAMGVVRGVSSVISLINGSISLLERLGIINSGKDKSQSILEGINSIQLSVNEIDKKVDKLQETLVSEFSELDIKFQEQDYNHYKNEVWAQFYSNAVVPLKNYQNEYKDDVRWLLVDYIEQWLDNDDCKMDLRSLYGKDDNGNFHQVYSGRNLGDVDTALPRAPKTSIDSVTVDYSITIPAEYISANLDNKTALTADNCTDKLISALEKGVYDAARDKKLSAYDGFETEWAYMTEAEKLETAKKFANDLADSLAFACAYNAANERRFASNVKSAYENFTKWVNGEESLTSPAFAQFKMLSLTHGFEGEIRDEASTIVTYLMLMDVNFATFTQTVISLSKAHDESDGKDIQSGWLNSEASIYNDYANFMTGNPNYCYQIGKTIEYRNTTVSSELSFIFGKNGSSDNDHYNIYKYEEYYKSTPWLISEKDASYASDRTTALDQKKASCENLKKNSISTKEAKLIYTMYQNSGIKGSFADYLAANNVTVDADELAKQLITSFNTSTYDLNSGVQMKCYLPARSYSENVTAGRTYAVSTGVSGNLESKYYLVHDQATGGLFNTSDGTFDENARLAARAFYGEEKRTNVDEMAVFATTDYKYKQELISQQEAENKGVYDLKDYFYEVVSDFSADYGMLISTEQNTYTFPESTKSVPDNVFGTALRYSKITFMGTPEKIGDNAFAGVGTKTNRCLLSAPAGMVTESLGDKWHGGYFGDVKVTLIKNDGTNEEKTVAAVNGASISTVLCPFSAPAGRVFRGWSLVSASNAVLNSSETVTAGKTLYAVWGYDHEHDFEVKSEYKAPTCTRAGATVERTCKTCGLEEKSEEILPLGHSCDFTKNADGTYLATCKVCGHSVTLYPQTISDYTVWCERGIYLGYDSSERIMYIGDSAIFVIENTDKTVASPMRLQVGYSVKQYQNVLTFALAGVNIIADDDFPAIRTGIGTTRLTLLDGTENFLTATGSANALKSLGNLIIDGSGTLTAKSKDNYAISSLGMNTIIESGNIKAECEKSTTKDIRGIGIFSDSSNSKFIISDKACVYATNGTNVTPTNSDGDNVYAVRIYNEKNEAITVDGNEFPYTAAPGEKAAYIYLTAEQHEIKIGDDELEHNWVYGPSCFEKQFGGLIVTTTDIKSVSYADNVLTVNDSTPVTIRNANKGSFTKDTIFVPAGVNANITLNGVFIEGSADRPSPIKIADGSNGDVKITLAPKSENTLIAKFEGAGISKNGSAGTLTIDGKGTLNVQGGYYSGAAIGSEANNVVHGIIINDGIINATVHTEKAAAIGSGYIRKNAELEGDKIYVAEGIIINGGKITARSEDGAAIGAGVADKVDGKTFAVKDIIINDGIVNAKGVGADYSIGAGENVSAENIRINRGIVTAESTQFSGGGIGAGLGAEIFIESTASVKAADFSNNPLAGNNTITFFKTVDVEPLTYVTVDGQIFPYTDHEGEPKLYLYLKPLQSIKVGTMPRLEIVESDRGTVSANVEMPKAGDTVTLKVVAKDGYAFRGFETTPEVEIKDNSFTMPEYGVSVKAVFGRIGKITVKDCENCTVTPSKTTATAGEKITLRVAVETGMELSRWDVAAGNVTITNNTFIMPEEDVVISGICTPVSYKLTWDVLGNEKYTYVPYGTQLSAPATPEKGGYIFEGWTPELPETMPAENLTISAVFTPITYNATFVADGKTVAKVPYTVADKSVTEPSIPQKTGYVASWGDYRLDVGGVTVNAEYVPELYKARFVADGVVVDEIPYTVETISIDAPVIPNKDGFTAKWSDYTLSAGGITVNAVYTASSHEHIFATKYSTNEHMHWYASTCGHEDIAKGLGEHTFGKPTKAGSAMIYVCTECSYVKIVDDELAELKAQAIAEFESAAGTDKSEAMQSAVDLAKTAVERATTKEEVESAKESGLAVIRASVFAIGNCTTNGSLIYGVEPALTESSFADKYIVNDTVSVEYKTSAKDVLGTGSTVSVTYFSGKTDEYSVVVFGDVNGDGWYDGMDAVIVNSIANGMIKQEDVDEAIWKAADCNHDGVIDTQDVDILNQAGLLLQKVDQSKPTEELLSTSSAYAEYLNLIDQDAETEINEPETDNHEGGNADNTTTDFFGWIINFFRNLVAFIKSMFGFIVK